MKNYTTLPIFLFLTLFFPFTMMFLGAQNLEGFRWQNRIVIVKSNLGATSQYQKQLQEFENAQAELSERKMVAFYITDESYKMIDYTKGAASKSDKLSTLFANDVLNKQHDFEVVLIGLDGGVKLRQTELLTKEQLFQLIDSMPMRANEIKRRNR